MTFRFTLSHTPYLPPFDQFVTAVGDVEWDLDLTPSVTLPGPDNSLIKASFGLAPGTYSIDYDFDITNSGIAVITFDFTKDNHTVIVATDTTGNLSGAGNYTGTFNFTLTEAAEGARINFANFSAVTKVLTINSMTLNGGSSQVISEPDGWEGATLSLERDMDLFSLIETFTGGANDAFIFYGDNGTENGGIDFIRQVESTYGFDADITFLIEYAPDDVTYSTLFTGLLDLSAKNEMKDNRMQVPVVRDSMWTKFINRFETPVNVQSTTTLDGNACDPCPSITIKLSPQALRARFDGSSSSPGVTDADVNVIVSGTYYPMSWDTVALDEIEEVFLLLQVDNTEIPVPVMELKYGGTYSFTIQTTAYDYLPGSGGYNFGVGEDLSDYIRFYININGTETEFAIGDLFQGDNIDGGRVYTLNLTNQILEAGTLIQIYGKAIASLTATPSWAGEIRWNGPVSGNLSVNHGGSAQTEITVSAQVTGDTVYPETEAEGFLIHDLFHAVATRITQ